jgi:ribonuclease R
MPQVVGILQMQGRGGSVFPDGKNDIGEVFIPAGELRGAPFGMKVVVELTSAPDADQATGKVLKVLGDPNRPDVAMEGIIHMHGLRQEFPDEVIAQAMAIPDSLSEAQVNEEISRGREDLRHLKTLTIDGMEAKDLDDAISIEKTRQGFRLWVHIADVAHYVTEDSPMDKEALERGNSVYLADRVLPMLPAQLSNGICSLNPGQDRFTLSVALEYGKQGQLLDGNIMESVIRSDLRANYDDILTSITNDKPVAGYEDFMDEIRDMAVLAGILEEKSQDRGALEFDFVETKIEVDKEGRVTDIHPDKQSFANEIIEQFMIEANRFVGLKCKELNLPFLYRVHDWPDPEKLDVFRELVKRQGGHIRISHQPRPKELSLLLEDLKDLPGSEALQTLLLRSLAKAEYRSEPIGHYGLALHDYSHFTAPIRRYSDLFIHRVLKGFLRGEVRQKQWEAKAPKVAKQCSDMERVAIEAERDSVDQKVAEYYKDRLGEIYEAEVTGFVGAGMFVRLPTSAEGMVPFRTMDDYYMYDEVTMTALGRGHRRLFKIGDRFDVQVVRVDTIKRQVDLVLVDEKKSGRIDMTFHQASNQEKKKFNRNDKKHAGKSGKSKKDKRKGKKVKKSGQKRRKNKRRNK